MAFEKLTSDHRVTSFELDAFGHVNNAVFLNYLEKARNDFLHQKGLTFNHFFEWERFPVVVRAKLEFKLPALSGDELQIIGWVSNYGKTTFTMSYEITNRNTKKMVFTGETQHAFVDRNNRLQRIPQQFLSQYMGIT